MGHENKTNTKKYKSKKKQEKAVLVRILMREIKQLWEVDRKSDKRRCINISN